ncbi:IS30 family transposase [Streptomyces sp. NPDC003032]
MGSGWRLVQDPVGAVTASGLSRYSHRCLPDGTKAEQVTPHLTRGLPGIPPQLRRALPWDQGGKMAERQAVTAGTGMPICLCKPRSPWQRGINENTSRSPRQYLPKGANIRTFSQAGLDAIAHEFNHRRRMT